MTEQEEGKLYYIICEIARTCKKYFYERKYMPDCCWSIDDVVKKISTSTKKLNKKYKEIKNNNK